MKQRFRRAVVILCATALSPTAAAAAGYHLYEQGAAALGMAGAATASIADASALFFNPAALTRVEGTQVLVGGTMLTPTTSFAGVAPYPGYGVTEEMKSKSFFPPTVYLTHRSAHGWAVGAGLNSPFGLGVEWKDPDSFTGRYIVTRADLKTLNGNVTAAYAFGPQWSAAVGADALFAKVELRNRILAPIPGGGGAQVDVAEAKLTSNYDPGYGWNAALSFVPAAAWKLGAVYRSKVIVDVDDGEAEFRQIPTGNGAFDAAVAASLPPDQTVSTVLRFPAVWSAGVAWMPREAWTLEADANFVEWSVFTDLPIRLSQTPSSNRDIREDYEDAWQFRFGAQHRGDLGAIRFGYYFDQAAAPTPSLSALLPDADRHGVTLGFGRSFGRDGRWTADVYDLALFLPDRSTDGVNRDGYEGTYHSFINAAGLGLSHRW